MFSIQKRMDFSGSKLGTHINYNRRHGTLINMSFINDVKQYFLSLCHDVVLSYILE